MNANTGDLQNGLPPHAKRTVANDRIGTEPKEETASNLRSRLLDMILDSEQHRKVRVPSPQLRRP